MNQTLIVKGEGFNKTHHGLAIVGPRRTNQEEYSMTRGLALPDPTRRSLVKKIPPEGHILRWSA